jgi:hypothetical protein
VSQFQIPYPSKGFDSRGQDGENGE